MTTDSSRSPAPKGWVPTRPFPLGALVLGGGAAVLTLFLVVGFLLPADWRASAELQIAATPAEIFDHIDSPEGWRTWTTWPDGELSRSGPESGAGATLSWEDDEMGSGAFAVTSSVEPLHLEYSVEFGPSMRARGVVSLSGNSGGTLVKWSESGNLGRNPLMGYWALFMPEGQGREMLKGLERLAGLVELVVPTVER